MAKVILGCFFLCSLVNVSFQRIVEVNHHPANFTIEPRSDCECGIKSVSRIVGGSNTDMNEYPWMVALCIGATCSSRSQFCGGALISGDYIMTAAHCIEGMSPQQLSISVGDHDMSSGSETNSQVYRIEKIIKHKGYNPQTVVNDIALLKVKGNVKFNDNVSPACLPLATAPYSNKIATATGWGTTSSGGSSSTTLKEVQVKVLSNQVCRKRYGRQFKAGMLCAGSKNRDSCQGDSGGPLVLKNAENKWELVTVYIHPSFSLPCSLSKCTRIGVVSWGVGCGEPGYPGVYTRVKYFMDWIKTNGVHSQCSS